MCDMAAGVLCYLEVLQLLEKGVPGSAVVSYGSRTVVSDGSHSVVRDGSWTLFEMEVEQLFEMVLDS